jgi:GNAT superfamily N-acetyltransferase
VHHRLTLGNIGFTVESDSVEEAETIYAALADSGDASMPFAKAPWGDYFGMVIDRFGVGFNITVPASASSLDKSAQRMIRAEGIDLNRATHERAHDVAAMLSDFNAEFDTPCPSIDVLTERFQRLLRRDDVIVCIADGEKLPAGFAFVTLRPSPYYEGPIAMLEELYVHPELRGRGIGTAIMDLVETAVSKADVIEIQINVDEVDVDARRFYEGRGFSHYEDGNGYRMFCYFKELTR